MCVLGAFEYYVNDKIVYSKLHLQRYPNMEEVKEEEIQNYKTLKTFLVDGGGGVLGEQGQVLHAHVLVYRGRGRRAEYEHRGSKTNFSA